MQKKSRNILLDIFKIVAAILIVCIHCGFLYNENKVAFQLTSNGFFRIAVPFFYCVNGFFLFDVFKNQAIKKWTKRVAILYFVWMLIYSYFWISPAIEAPLKLIQILVFGFNHLWYLIALLFGGLLLYTVKSFSNTILLFTSIGLFCIGLSIQYLGVFNVFSELPLLDKILSYPNVHRNFLFFVFPLVSLGYIIRRKDFTLNLSKTKVLLFLALGCIVVLIEHLINFHILQNETLLNMNMAYLFLCPALLIIAIKFKVTSSNYNKLFGEFAIAIYLIHPLIIFQILRLFDLDSTPLTMVTIVLSVLASYVLILLNKKLKFIL